MLMNNIKNHFDLPITYSKNVKDTPKNLFNDLELIENVDMSTNTIYNVLIKPETKIGSLCFNEWSTKYTTDVEYLKNTQELIEKIKSTPLHKTNDLVLKAWDSYKTIKENSKFTDDFQYISWKSLKFLNTSVLFLTVLSFYSIISPLLNLVAPLLILLVPFLLMRMKKMPITFKSYLAILLISIKNHSFGKLITQWNSTAWSQKLYLLFMTGMYFYNIYQNAISCYNFYKNTYVINNDIITLTEYTKHTNDKLTQYMNIIKDLPGYKKYYQYLQEKQTALNGLHENLKIIPTKGYHKRAQFIGNTMRMYYKLYVDTDIEDCLLFSFGFHSYCENLSNIVNLIQKNKISKATILDTKKPTLKINKGYFPLVQTDKIVTNNINLKQNKLITGPNASGKTTLLKSTLTNILISQQIGYGFYKNAKITPFDFIHSYLNIPDTSCRDSLFQAEARRCLNILNIIKENQDKKHFCIFDELYSGTNPYEAISGAKAYLEEICKYKQVKFLLTTHYIQLCERLNTHECISNINMKFEMKDNIPKYKYKIQNGICKIKGGVAVLRELGYPENIIEDACKNVNKL
jgi:hypothetical protein